MAKELPKRTMIKVSSMVVCPVCRRKVLINIKQSRVLVQGHMVDGQVCAGSNQKLAKEALPK